MIPPDAMALADALARGETTALATTEAALARIDAEDGEIRAFISLDRATALAAAAESDARRAAGLPRGPLDGCPVAVKDNIAVMGLPRTCGTALEVPPSGEDATVVARLRAAGAIVIGTLNMHEGALGATTDNPHWGTCRNPLAPGHTPGGSSGGSAAAIAACMVPLTLGTDTMGSVRIPAAYCGLWGLKPTRGRVPATGLVHLSWTLDSIGPLARSPRDLAAMLRAIEGPDTADPMSAPLPPETKPPDDLSGLIVGLPDAAALAACEEAVTAALAQMADTLAGAGAILRPVEIAGWAPGKLRRAGLLISEVEGAATLGDAVEGPGLSEPFRAMLRYGRDAGAVRLAGAYRQVQHMAQAFDTAMQGLDALLLPTAPQRAFPHGAEVPANQADLTALANVAGAPALSLPVAAPGGGLPVGIQIVGPRGSDPRLLGMGTLMQALAPLRDWSERETHA